MTECRFIIEAIDMRYGVYAGLDRCPQPKITL